MRDIIKRAWLMWAVRSRQWWAVRIWARVF